MTPAPALPEGLEDLSLAADVRRDLLGLRKEVADSVSRHLVAAGSLLEDDPEQALVHARYARTLAARLAVVREAVGLAAYHAGEWAEAIAELRAARRMGGGPGHIAVIADAERALGRPERALELARGPEVADLDEADRIEVRIVAAGARRDLGELDAAVLSLQIPELDPALRNPWSARLFYAYADALLAAGRQDDAVRWFLHTTDADDEELTDAAERLSELSGQSPAVREILTDARSGRPAAAKSSAPAASAPVTTAGPEQTGSTPASGSERVAGEVAGNARVEPGSEADQPDPDGAPDVDAAQDRAPDADAAPHRDVAPDSDVDAVSDGHAAEGARSGS